MSERREELLQAAVEWTLDHGLSQLSLRPLAKDLKTSARMLIYHFESREGLIEAILEHLFLQWETRISVFLNESDSPRRALQELWRQELRSPESQKMHRLILDLWIGATIHQDPTLQKANREILSAWQEAITTLVAPPSENQKEAQAKASLLLASMDGLLLQSLSDSELDIDAPFELLLEKLFPNSK